MNEKRSQKYSQKYDAVQKREYRAQKRNRKMIEEQEKCWEYDHEQKWQKLAIETNQEKEQHNERCNNLRKMMNQRARDFNRDKKEAEVSWQSG